MAAAAGALVLGCSSDDGDVAPTATIEATTVASPPAAPAVPVDADDAVWADVIEWTAGNLSPILRPSVLPSGLQTVAMVPNEVQPDTRMFEVKYSGLDRSLSIRAGRINPPPAPPGGSGEQLMVRGQAATLVTEDEANPSVGSWLYWEEPGKVIGKDGQASETCTYQVRAEGYGRMELIEVAESLQEYP